MAIFLFPLLPCVIPFSVTDTTVTGSKDPRLCDVRRQMDVYSESYGEIEAVLLYKDSSY
jgi:hypothetical protein